MFEHLVETIRVRSRQEWIRLFVDYIEELRCWVQDHGELALLVGFLVGFVFFAAFKVFISVGVCGALVATVIILVAKPE